MFYIRVNPRFETQNAAGYHEAGQADGAGSMKIAVVGLGAVGGLIAVRLARAGHEVSALARGATLAAVREHGIRLLADNKELRARVVASDDAATLGPQDLVVVALKGPALVDAAASLQPLLGAQTVVMPAMNGVPWWFLQPGSVAVDAGLTDTRLPSVDPGVKPSAFARLFVGRHV